MIKATQCCVSYTRQPNVIRQSKLTTRYPLLRTSGHTGMSTAKPKLANSTTADSHPAPPLLSDGSPDGRNGSRPDLAPARPRADGAPAEPRLDRNEGYKVQGTRSPRPTLEALLKLVQSYYSDLD